jgi:hypothetical protein
LLNWATVAAVAEDARASGTVSDATAAPALMMIRLRWGFFMLYIGVPFRSDMTCGDTAAELDQFGNVAWENTQQER